MPEDQTPWPLEQADSLSFHVTELAGSVCDSIQDGDVVTAHAILDKIFVKARELRRELNDAPILTDVAEKEKED